MVTVPNVVGMNSSDAQNTLTSLGLNYSIVEIKDTNVEKGKVISTSPSAGGLPVEEGTSVKLYVSKGQEIKPDTSGNGTGNNNSNSGNNSGNSSGNNTGNNSQQGAAGNN